MHARLWISESLSKAEIDHVDVPWFLITDQEIVWLDVPMEVIALVNMLDSLKALNCDHDNGFEAEFFMAHLLEEVLKRVSETLHNHNVVVSFNDGTFELRNAFALE